MRLPLVHLLHVIFRSCQSKLGTVRSRGLDADERYLARSVDAHDFEVRIQALERRRN